MSYIHMDADIKIKVGVLIINEKDEVLLIREGYEKLSHNFWNIISGTHIEKETLFETAIREAKEETGTDVKLINILGIYFTDKNGKVRIRTVFTANIINGVPSVPSSKEQIVRSESIEEIKWFSKSEVQSMTPENLISDIARQALNDWLCGSRYPLKAIKQI